MSASVSVTLHVVRIGLGTENLDDLLVPRACRDAAVPRQDPCRCIQPVAGRQARFHPRQSIGRPS